MALAHYFKPPDDTHSWPSPGCEWELHLEHQHAEICTLDSLASE